MKYNELLINRQKKSARAGRGISAGRGKTAGRGTKGQGSRKSPIRSGFEGGQMPLYMRLPKLRGFKSHRTTSENIYTGQLDAIKKTSVNTSSLYDAGLISSPHVSVKLLYKGEITSKKDVSVQAASQKSIEALEKAAGSFKRTARLPRPTKKLDKASE